MKAIMSLSPKTTTGELNRQFFFLHSADFVTIFYVTLVWLRHLSSSFLPSLPPPPLLKVFVSLLVVLRKPWLTRHVAITLAGNKNAVARTVVTARCLPSVIAARQRTPVAYGCSFRQSKKSPQSIGSAHISTAGG